MFLLPGTEGAASRDKERLNPLHEIQRFEPDSHLCRRRGGLRRTVSPIQQAIPPVLAGRDPLGCAQTGTGKTAAFAMPILQRLAAAPAPSSGGRPIRAPFSRRPASLRCRSTKALRPTAAICALHTALFFGGVNQNPLVARLKKGRRYPDSHAWPPERSHRTGLYRPEKC